MPWYAREPWPGRVVLAVFLWVPVWLVLGLAFRELLTATLIFAFAPVAIGAVALAYVLVKEASAFGKAVIVLLVAAALIFAFDPTPPSPPGY